MHLNTIFLENWKKLEAVPINDWTQSDYCRQHGLEAKTFFRGFRLSQTLNQRPALAPVNIVQGEVVQQLEALGCS